jgi:uncharacterized DUF497 family protein
MTSAVKICRADPLTLPGETYRQTRRRYTTRAYLSRAIIVVSPPGEVFFLTEDLLMGDPYTGIKQG